MASLNKVMIIGNVGSEPEMRFTPSGKSVTSFSVACNDKWGGQDTTEWFNVQSWGKLAETCNQYISKGQQVFVEGRLHTNKWEDNDGNQRQGTEVVASKVVFLGSKKQRDEDSQELEPGDVDF